MPGMAPKFVSAPATFRRRQSVGPALRALAGQRGVSILELLFGAAIIAVAAVGVAVMFGTSQSLVQSGGTNRIMTYLAQQRIEQVRAAGFGLPSLPDPRQEANVNGVDINNFNDNPATPDFKRETLITGVCPTNFTIPYNDGGCPSSPNIEAKLVTVVVRKVEIISPLNSDPQSQPVILQTILVRP